MRFPICLLAFLLAARVNAEIRLPEWLAPYPGVAAETIASTPELIEIQYTAKATSNEVMAHLRSRFDSAGIGFVPNQDGIGTSIRAGTPECDLLIRVRETAGGVTVKSSCSQRTAAPPGGAAVGAASSQNSRLSARRPRSLDEAGRLQDENHRRVMAEAEADHQRRMDDMSRYDQPVRVAPRSPRPAGAAPAQRSFFNNDAPPLAWPAWLVQEGTSAPPKPVAGFADRHEHLESRYKTTAAMTHLFRFYENLLNSRGFRVSNSRLETGQTITGNVIQNAWGHVEGSQSTDGTVNGPSTRIRVSFSRSYLNGPITVTIRVTVAGSFGNRR